MIVLLPQLPGLSLDNECWRDWALYIREHGLKNAYGSTSDYLPFYQYVLWGYAKIAGSSEAIARNIPYLRLFTILFDLTGIVYIYKWIDKKVDLLLIFIVSILNIAYSYDTIIWGQVDGILSAMLFIALYYAFKQNIIWSGVWYLMAINLKLQAIILLPLWGLLIINTLITTRGWKKLGTTVGVMLVLQSAVIYPFTLGQYGADKIWAKVNGAVDLFPVLNIGAPNFWNWVKDGYLRRVPDNVIWFSGLTYKQVGLFLFCLSSFIVLLPICILIFRRLNNAYKNTTVNKQIIWLTAALLYLVFFYFNTQMHERYCQPAFIFIAAYSFFNKNYFPYILFSITYFLTLEFCIESMHLPNYHIFIMSPRFLASLYTIIIAYLLIKLYRLSLYTKPATLD